MEHHLGCSLKTVVAYAQNDNEMSVTAFPSQVSSPSIPVIAPPASPGLCVWCCCRWESWQWVCIESSWIMWRCMSTEMWVLLPAHFDWSVVSVACLSVPKDSHTIISVGHVWSDLWPLTFELIHTVDRLTVKFRGQISRSLPTYSSLLGEMHHKE